MTFAQAVVAQNRLLAQVGSQAWFRGLGIGVEKSSCFLRLTVDKSAPLDLPTEIDGVQVVIIRTTSYVCVQ